jgi:hypothetical protein
MPTFWTALEQVPGLNAIAATWTGLMGPAFETVRATYFRKQAEPARAWFCEKCYCAHEVVADSAARPEVAPLVAVCRCETGRCPDITLTPGEIEIWELSWPSLGRALCRALGLEASCAEMPIYNTRQIGSWSAGAVPAFLTIQTEPEDLRGAIAELVARLQHPFILLTPTAIHLNATCRELLTHANAGFLPLDSTVLLTPEGALRPVRPPGELFAPFTPQPEEDNQQLLIAAVALVQRLESIRTKTPPTPLNVFYRHYVLQQSAVRIAKDSRCARATVGNRLRAIHALLGHNLAGFERYAPHFQKILDQMSDPRARSIYLKGLFSNDPES